MEKVVKCNSCDKFFGWTEEDKACRFCNAVYGEGEDKTEGEEGTKVKIKIKSDSKKSGKESFRIWKNGQE